jgi:hypothetical protein
MKHGFIYPVFKLLFDNLKYLNLVEFFKFFLRLFNPDKTNSERVKNYNRIATDIFVVSKWLTLILFWHYSISSWFVTLLIWYLIFANIYTYLYYHIWCDDALKTDEFTKGRIRRRFVHLILAITFSVYCFAYLYQLPYSSEIDWGTKYPASMYSIMFSFSNSVAANYSDIKPLTDIGNIIASIQLLITFIFATIILSRSIPQTNSQT